MSAGAAALAFLAIGANLPDDPARLRGNLEATVARLPQAGFAVQKRSRWWCSQAWPHADDPPFLNAVLLVRTQLQPLAALDALQALEREAGRTAGARNGPRPLDLDLIAYDDLILSTERLILPHPRAAERLFVIGPLAEIAPDFRWPGNGRSASALAAEAAVGLDAAPERGNGPDG